MTTITNAWLFAFDLGIALGALWAWMRLKQKQLDRPAMPDVVLESAVQMTFIRAAGEVLTDEENNRVRRRANEILDEYDMPVQARWFYRAR